MPKVLGDNTKSNSRYFQKGVFVDRAKILSVEDLSNYPKKPGAEVRMSNSGKPRQLCLKCRVDVGIEMDMYVFGGYNYKKDPISGKQLEYMGWQKKKNAVQNLLYKLLGTNAVINDDDSIPLSTLNKLIGQEFFKLRYTQKREFDYEGRPSTKMFWIFEKAIEGGDDVLYKEWLKVAGNVDDYDPNHWDEYQEQLKADETKFQPEEDVI